MDNDFQISDETLNAYSQEHLYYEFSMFFGVSKKLREKQFDDLFSYNALLESFVIHGSNILDFFYKKQLRPDDAKALHYVNDPKHWKKILPPFEPNLQSFNTRRNKQVVHLSYTRLNVQPHEKVWHATKVTEQMTERVRLFLENADPKKIHPKIFQILDQLKEDSSQE
ncbi:MAG: hypothetical protein KC713_05295 [Candidatus Omnitrophica bacterium]|nr:hypothetical protein [Candidatus Omnitrophota bacterium]